MTNRPLRARRRAAPAPGLRDVLERVLDDIVDATPFEKVVVVAGLEGDLLGMGRGVPADEADAFARALSDWRTSPRAESAAAGISPLQALASLGSPVLVPAPSQNPNFSAVVVVEGVPEHPALARISEILRAVTPDIAAAAKPTHQAPSIPTASIGYAHSALDSMPDPVLVVDADGRVLFCNRRAGDLFGVGMAPHAADGARARAAASNKSSLTTFLEKNGSGEITASPPRRTREILLLDPDSGSDLVFEVLSTILDDVDGVGGHLLVLHDVSDSRAAARELELAFSRSVAAEHDARLESERLDVIVQNAAVPLFVTDGEARIRLVNREAARLLEPRPGPALTSPQMRDVAINHERLTGFVGEILRQPRARRGGRLVLVDPDEARELPVLAVSTKILDERDEPTAVVTVLLDLSQEAANRQLARATGELARRNTQLEEEHTALERAARLKNEFLATMSHELRTPINAVLGYNSLLRDGLFGQLSERQRDALDRMRNAAEHLLSLVNDVLDLTRVEAGRIWLTPTEIDWPPLLESLSESVRPLAAGKALTFTVEVEPGLPALRTDEVRLHQVLLNLLTNAVKFTDHGQLELQVRSAPDGNRVQIDVIDTGIGIDVADLETIFEEFTQVDQSSTREHGGAGLGLAISRRLIRLMGGSLTVKSAPGRGSTFRVDLPLVPPNHRDAETSRLTRPRVAS